MSHVPDFDLTDAPPPVPARALPLPALPQGSYHLCPFRIIVDTREQAPFHFRGIKCDADKKYKPLVVPLLSAGLKTGDYSIDGFEDRIAVERKSLTDLYGTIGGGRERFERELARLNEMQVAAVVIEADWESILNEPPADSKLSPKVIFRSINSWEQRYPRVHWHPMGSRSWAEHKCFRVLERFWKEHGER